MSVAPFSWLAERYGDALAVLWIDSHPDVGNPASHYSGYHAMAIAALTGHGDPDVLRLLPATLDPGRVALVGLHAWSEDDFPNIARWGISSFRPDELHRSSQPLLDWLEASGCSRVLMLSSTPRARFTYPGIQSDTPPPPCFPVLSGAGRSWG